MLDATTQITLNQMTLLMTQNQAQLQAVDSMEESFQILKTLALQELGLNETEFEQFIHNLTQNHAMSDGELDDVTGGATFEPLSREEQIKIVMQCLNSNCKNTYFLNRN